MKIYTGFGDEGNTTLFGGQVVKKNNIRVEIYGGLDELNSFVGLLRAKNTDRKVDELLLSLQEEIFIISSEVATPDLERQKKMKNRINDKHIQKIEITIDRFSENLEPLKNFILPGGAESAAIAHVARTICRRIERNLTVLYSENQVSREILVYLNRLSDLFFVLARYLNKLDRVPDILWKS